MIILVGIFLISVFEAGHISDKELLQARLTKARADIHALAECLDNFKRDNGRYPTTSENIASLRKNPGNLPDWKSYLKEVPLDPWGRPYIYRSPGHDGRDFDLICTGVSGQEGNADNITQ
jgi:general secretion pathway protein G